MLPLKKGLCPICNDGKLKPLISGVCQIHYWAGQRAATTAPSRSIRIERAIVAAPREKELDHWYERIASSQASYCWECGELIARWNAKFAKASVAHILPKEIFESIQTQEHNFLILGAACGCHTRWDKNWKSASKMKVFPIAAERVKIIFPYIAADEIRRIPDIFLPYIV